MSLFVLASKDGWVNIMYNGLDAVAVDQQVGVARAGSEGQRGRDEYFWGLVVYNWCHQDPQP